MARTKIILLALAMAIIGAVAPIAFMAWLSWSTVLNSEQRILASFAERVMVRTNVALSQASSALKILTPLTLQPCSEEHIAKMRQVTANSRAIDEIGYIEAHQVKCTSWGRSGKYVAQDHTDFSTSDGIKITTKMMPAVSAGSPMMALRYGDHNALINLDRFVDVMANPNIHLVLARTDGTVVVESGVPAGDLIRRILDGEADGENSPYLFSSVSQNGWTAIAIANKEDMHASLRREQLWMLPLGAFTSLFIVFLVLRMSRQRLSPVEELRLAIKNREFVVHYQPIIDLRNGRCSGAEALVRWQRPDGSMVRPDFFIPLAEESGLILPITDLVIKSVISELKEALVADRSLHIAINLCANDIKTGRVLPVIADALATSGIHSEQIWLEATERGFMDITSARATLNKAREMGHITAIDDFGTGYSSLQYLQDLPMDVLKIDKSFVDTIGTDAASNPVISHIIDMAKSLNLLIVAEGVETQEQADYLSRRNVDFVQGWLYAKALPADEFLMFCRDKAHVLDARCSGTPTRRLNSVFNT